MEELKKKYRWVFLALPLLVAPFTGYILSGLMGMLALAVAFVVGCTLIFMAPVFTMKLANYRIKALVAEAEKNPIETLQNSYIAAAQDIESNDCELEDWETELLNFDGELEGIKRDYPSEAPGYQRISEQMHAKLEDARAQQVQARQDLEEAGHAITKAQRLYKMALAAQKVASFSKPAEERVLQEIKQQAALDSVRTNLNRSLSRLNTAMAQRGNRPTLPTVSAVTPALGAGSGPQAVPTTINSQPPLLQRRDREGS